MNNQVPFSPGWNDPPTITSSTGSHRMQRFKRPVDPSIQNYSNFSGGHQQQTAQQQQQGQYAQVQSQQPMIQAQYSQVQNQQSMQNFSAPQQQPIQPMANNHASYEPNNEAAQWAAYYRGLGQHEKAMQIEQQIHAANQQRIG
ncbi:hypothetical protein M3Y94_00289500 [Aphelenchoides besseyi]|nr:hypothetical protein M3Y94_00289500 [Aphelenchoides besseyi]KAI6235917.1 hypothetical protein M3Y95_00102200 [Aphelenchoides besseyi]